METTHRTTYRGDLPRCEVANCDRAYIWTCQTCRHRFCGRHDDVQISNVGHDCDEFTDAPEHLKPVGGRA